MGVIAIKAVTYELAPHRITSSALEERIAATLERLGLPRGQFEQLIGMRERRFWDPGDIGYLINTSPCKDFIEPSVAVWNSIPSTPTG